MKVSQIAVAVFFGATLGTLLSHYIEKHLLPSLGDRHGVDVPRWPLR